MRGRLLLIVALLFVALPGCGGQSFVPFSGKVTLDGKPLAKATVTFIPQGQPGAKVVGESSSGTTDENGEYTLKTYTEKGFQDGTAAGKYKVSISKQETRGEGDRSVTRELIPGRYNQNTELTADVGSGNNRKDFELKSR